MKGYAVYGRPNDFFGLDLSLLGDFNNDGLADLAVG